VIAVTASAFDEDALAVMACGVDAYVRKPVDADALLHALGQALGLRYRTQDQEPGQTSHTLQPGHLAAIPQPLRNAMRQALSEGDMARLDNCLHRVAKLDTELAESLRRLAVDFEVEHLLHLLQDDAP
jgi:DNA-binding NarL/FixJ family response regulator